MQWETTEFKDNTNENQENKNSEFEIKEKTLNELLTMLKEKQEEAKENKLRLQSLLRDIANMEEANNMIEDYKKKNYNLEDALNNIKDEYNKFKTTQTKLWEDERENLNLTIKKLTKENEIYKFEINDLKIKVNELKKITDGMIFECGLTVKYDIYTEDPIIDIEELYKLREINRNHDMLMTQVEMKLKTKLKQITELENNVKNLKKLHKEELERKDGEILSLKEVLKTVDETINKIDERENVLKQKIAEEHKIVEEKEKQFKDLENINNKVIQEKEEALKQCQNLTEKITKNETEIAVLNKNCEELKNEIDIKTDELGKLKQYGEKLFATLSETKVKLDMSEMKFRDLKNTVVIDLKNKLQEKTQITSVLREMIKGERVDSKLRDYSAKKLRKGRNLKKFTHYFNTEEKEGTKIDNQPILDKPVENIQKDISEDRLENKITLMKPVKEKQVSFKEIPNYKEKYGRQVENYCNIIKSKYFRNNSINIKNAMNYGQNLLVPRDREDYYNDSIGINSVKSNNTLSKNSMSKYDVNKVIKKTLDKHLPMNSNNLKFGVSPDTLCSK